MFVLTPIEITFFILGAAVVLLLSDRLRPDLVALLAALALGLSGVLTAQEVFSGFSRSAVITIMAIYVLADGLRRTGVTDMLGGWLYRMAAPVEQAAPVELAAPVEQAAPVELAAPANTTALRQKVAPDVQAAAESSADLDQQAAPTVQAAPSCSTPLSQQAAPTEQAAKKKARKRGASGETRLVVGVTSAGALLSLFMNNIAAASVLLPAVVGLSHKSKYSPSRLLIPLAFGTILGGMATLFTTTNLVASSLLKDQGLQGYGVWDFAPLGAVVVLVGVAYLAVVGRHLLPRHSALQRLEDVQRMQEDLTKTYRLKERLVQARLPDGSPLSGVSLKQSGMREQYGMNVVAIERHGQTLLSPAPETLLQSGDVLLLAGKLDRFNPHGDQAAPTEQAAPSSSTPLSQQAAPTDQAAPTEQAAPSSSTPLSQQAAPQPLIDLLPEGSLPDEAGFESSRVTLAEAVLSPRSDFIGKTLRQVHFREKYGLNVIAIWRAGRPVRSELSEQVLQFGDGLLLLGDRQRIPLLHSEPNLILLNNVESRQPVGREKAWLSLTIMGGALLLATVYNALIAEILLAAALLMVLSGILTMDQAYQAIDWKSIFIIAGMLPLGVAMSKTGAAASMGNQILLWMGPAGPWALLAGLVVLTMLLAQVMNGAAVTAVMAPVAIQIAGQSGLEPRSLVMGVALATSLAFITPLGHPVNILVMGPGGYRFGDYVKVGLPLALLLTALVILALPYFWPLAVQ
jgi:di/tricarboxylate transporter